MPTDYCCSSHLISAGIPIVHPRPAKKCCNQEWIGEEGQRLGQRRHLTTRESLQSHQCKQESCNEPDAPHPSGHDPGRADEG
jgi:hypothetical protein